jgi:hypothetical protein
METLQTAYMPHAPTAAALEMGRKLFEVCRSALAAAFSPPPLIKPSPTPPWQRYAVYSGALSVQNYKSIERNP